jgi:hypothetical protein
MGNTTYQEINDLFMLQIQDYRLMDLYNTSILNTTTDFDVYLMGFMLLAIPDFIYCTQDLSNRDDADRTFNIVLTDETKKILSKFMVLEWLGKEVKDVLQMRLHVQDADFKTFAEANNLNAKQASYNMLREECSQLLTDIAYKNNNWNNWISGVFYP